VAWSCKCPTLTNRCWLVLAERAWRYDYIDIAEVRGSVTPRPLVPISISAPVLGQSGALLFALADSGAEYSLADWSLAEEIGIDPTTPSDEVVRLKIGGSTVDVHLCHVELTMYRAPGLDDPSDTRSWYGDIGFVKNWPAHGFGAVLGRRSFFDQWTVTFWGANRVFGVAPNG
jgi:hypothetical protein